MEPLTHATFEASDGQIIPLRSVHVEGDYVGLLSITTITQTYQNPIDQALEVTYTFPLVTGATLLDVTIQIRGNTFKSEAFPIHIGKQRYSEATKTGDTAIIIERSGPFYALQLGNLPGGEEVKITYRYGQFVMPHDGHVRVTVPTTIAPQYGNPQDSGIAPNRAPFTNMDATYPFSAVFRFHGIAQSRIYVVSHIAQITMHGNDCHVAINGATMDRDVVVHVNEFAQAYCSLYVPHAGQHWYASYVHLPAAQLENVAPMHIKLLVDCSGSMGGSSIRQAQQAVMRLLGLLRDGDSISVTRFGSNVVDVTPGLMRVGPVIRAQMNNWVKTIEADLGGTEIGGALEHVLKMPTNTQDCVIIVLTDGEAYGIKEVAKGARRQAHRIFPLVIGYTPTDGELKQLADITGGFSESVTPNERIEDAIERTINKIRFTPTHTTTLDFGDAVVAWTNGKSVRYAGEQGLQMTVTDRSAQPIWHVEETRHALTVQTVIEALQSDVVRMIAAQHLNDLNGTYQTEWAMKYGLMSEETVFVAVAVHESDKKVRDKQIRVKIAQEMAYNSHIRLGAPPRIMYSSPPLFMREARSMSIDRFANPAYTAHFDALDSHAPVPTMQPHTPRNSRTRRTNSNKGLLERLFSQDSTIMEHEDTSAHTKTSYAALLTKLLSTHRNDVTKVTLASLIQIGFSQDQIDACAQITGYDEQLIVAAIVVLILGESSARTFGIAVNTIPVALLGGLRIILAIS
ncbi:MAG: VWA domain-containing protein [Chloroflexi bacterium]|nr:VWA domain-containing protein [Chloroflexota bacterium]